MAKTGCRDVEITTRRVGNVCKICGSTDVVLVCICGGHRYCAKHINEFKGCKA